MNATEARDKALREILLPNLHGYKGTSDDALHRAQLHAAIEAVERVECGANWYGNDCAANAAARTPMQVDGSPTEPPRFVLFTMAVYGCRRCRELAALQEQLAALECEEAGDA